MFEWHREDWRTLNEVRLQNRLPHALLLTGSEGSGKVGFARSLAKALLCENTTDDGKSCGQCSACGWLQAGTHPDLLTVKPEEEGKAIRVDQIRQLSRGLEMTSHGGRYKVAIIYPADSMNMNAANSLLKTLEEPTNNTLIVLSTASPGKLPATIRSRCQKFALQMPTVEQGIQWLMTNSVEQKTARSCLSMTNNAPLLALELAESELPKLREERMSQLADLANGKLSPVRVAGEWHGSHLENTLKWWQLCLQELVRVRESGTEPVKNDEFMPKLQQIIEAVDCRSLFNMLDEIAFALRSFGSGLNKQLLAEDLLISWTNYIRPIRK